MVRLNFMMVLSVAASIFVMMSVFYYKSSIERNGTNILTMFYLDNSAQEKYTDCEWRKMLQLIPKSVKICDDLFRDFKLPFQKEWVEFNKYATNATKKYGGTEGHSGEVHAQTSLFYHVSNMDLDLIICEIGFNLGHSAFMWLRSSPNTRLYSFDDAYYKATKPMAGYMKSLFGERFHIMYGDSTKTVPIFTKENPELRCDILVVDGGHTYRLAKTDLSNMQKLANRKKNLVIFDDCPSTMFGDKLEKAWREMIEFNVIESLYECSTRERNRGFSVGRYVF